MDEYTPVITSIKHEQQFDTAGVPFEIVKVEYRVGRHGPFFERVRRSEFTAEKLQALMQATASTLRALGATSVQ